MTDLFSSPFRSFGSSFNVNNNNLSGKRRRFFDDEPNVENTYHNQTNDDCCYQPEKRSRAKSFITPQYQNDDRFNEMERAIQRLENEVNYLKENIDKKDEEVNNLSLENSSIHEQCETISNNNIKLNEENKILKKAVAIQENKQKELLSQIQHMQDIMNQAADYISGLERTNAILKHQVANGNYPESFLPDLPPDVY